MDHMEGRENENIHVPQQQIRKRDIATVGYFSGFENQTLWRFDVEEIVRPSEVLIPELETMTAFYPVRVINEIVRLRNLKPGPPGSCPHRSQAAEEEERRYARIVRPRRDSG